jgi:hypothetical protein
MLEINEKPALCPSHEVDLTRSDSKCRSVDKNTRVVTYFTFEAKPCRQKSIRANPLTFLRPSEKNTHNINRLLLPLLL